MVVSSQARKMARKMISERGKLLLVASLIQILVTVVAAIIIGPIRIAPWNFTFTPVLASMLSTFLTTPIILGMLNINNMVYYKSGCSFGNFFDFFRSYHVTLKAIGVRLALTAMLLAVMIPLITMLVFILPNLISSTWFLPILLFILFILLVVLVFSVAISGVQRATCLAALRYPTISFGKLFSVSFNVGCQYICSYICLWFSFTGWWILGSLLLIIPLVITVPDILSGFISVESFSGASGILFIGTALFALYLVFLSVYMTASATVFFNCAIDEYEQNAPKNGGSELREEGGEMEEERD